ncbi:MAG TPA: alpha/beta hydrolase [Usitatibacteraceae bacterium]|nr:alpha/beta hydrolase [Usitatibacteraceae bacterium]
MAAELARESRVACPDVAGRGESDRLASAFQYHFPQYLSDIHALLAQLGVKKLDWVGTSMGGLLGMMLAAQPGSPIRRLVMNDVGAFLPMGALQHIGRNLEAPATFASLAEVETHMRHTHRDWGEITDAQWRHLAIHGARLVDGEYRLHFDPQLATPFQSFAVGPGLFFWDKWAQVRCPVLLIRGEHSDVFPRSVADLMLTMNPGARLVEIPGCGHAPSLMAPSQIAIVQEFLAKPDKAASRAKASLTRATRSATRLLRPSPASAR